MPPDAAGWLQTPGLSACLSQEDPREFQTPVHCLSDSFLGPQHSTCTRGFNYRLENLGGEGRQRGRPVRISLETSVHVRTAHGVQFLPSLNEQALGYGVIFSSNFFVQSLFGWTPYRQLQMAALHTPLRSFSSCRLLLLILLLHL